MARIPSRPPRIEPLPPDMSVPPMITAVMTSSGAVMPVSGMTARTRTVYRRPAKAEIRPLRQYTRYFTRFDADAREERGLLVGSHGEDAPADRGEAQQDDGERGDHDQDDEEQRKARARTW